MAENINTPTPSNIFVERFDNPETFRAAYLECGFRRQQSNHTDRDWYSGETEQDTLRYCERGNDTLVPAARKLMDKFEATFEAPVRQWQHTPAGIIPCIPDVIAGNPDNMRRWTVTDDDAAPIRVIVPITSSGGIDAHLLERRGTAALALVMALQARRPVDLEIMVMSDCQGIEGKHHRYTMVRIETRPLSLAHACWLLTSQGAARRMGYAIAGSRNGNKSIHWPPGYISDEAKYCKEMATALQLGASDLLMRPSWIYDPAVQDPEKWIVEQYNRMTGDADRYAAA